MTYRIKKVARILILLFILLVSMADVCEDDNGKYTPPPTPVPRPTPDYSPDDESWWPE